MSKSFKTRFGKFVPGLIGLLLLLISFFIIDREDRLAKKPQLKDLTLFEGQLIEHNINRKSRRVSLVVKSKDGVFTFDLPTKCHHDFTQAIQIGQNVVVHYHREGIWSPIRAWSVESEVRVVVNYNKLNGRHQCE